MKIRNILFTITLLFCVMLPTGTNAQSAYQKKCTEIYVKYYSIFTYGRVQKLSTEESLAMAMYGAEVFAYGAIMEAVYKNPQSAKNTLKKMEAELKQAESLMTSEERYLHNMLKSSYGVLKLTIRNEVTEWAAKGEFETTDQYKDRLEHDISKKFNNLCENAIPEPTYKIRPIKYNADNETYSYEIAYTIKFEGAGGPSTSGLMGQAISSDKEFSSKINATIPIDISNAQKIKNNDFDADVVSCIWGRRNDTIYPQKLILAIGDNQYTIETGATDLIIRGEELNVEKVSLKGLSYNFTRAETVKILQQTIFPKLIIKYNNRLSIERDSANNLIKQSPYYIRLKDRENFLVKTIAMSDRNYSSETEIEDEFNSKHHTIIDELQKALNGMRVELRKDKAQYIEVLRNQIPSVVDSLQDEYSEYRCHYPHFADFVMAFEDNQIKPSEKDCRIQAKTNYLHYFETEKEFNDAYDKGDSYLTAQVKYRQAKIDYLQYFENEDDFNRAYEKGDKYFTAQVVKLSIRKTTIQYFVNNDEFDEAYGEGTSYFNELVNKRRANAPLLISFEEYVNTPYKSDKIIGQQKLKGAAESSNQSIKQIADLFSSFKDDIYSYNKAALILLKVNEKMRDEYEDNGMFFSSVSEFVESYLSEEYKSILKQKKKDAKN